MSAQSTLSGPTRDHLEWPFFDVEHREFARAVDDFAKSSALTGIDHADVDNACRKLVLSLGDAGLLRAAVGTGAPDAAPIDSRLVCIARETLAWHDDQRGTSSAKRRLYPELRGVPPSSKPPRSLSNIR